ncbi:MAG: amino acid permease [Planctomycetota bacterium]|jgi:amino acid transporter
MSDAEAQTPAEGEPRKFGTFLGVFTPSVLTILGVIMYLRFGWVVANAGLGGTILIVLICNAIALITGLSASAVATNMPLGAGGEYYLISRSLGLTIGGAIGIPLFLCRILSLTLYCFGLAEVIGMFWPGSWGAPPVAWLAAGLIVITTAVAGKSASVALRLQVPLMVVVGLSMLALAIGTFRGELQAPQWGPSAERMATSGGFWAVLAVFFPAVTGFAAGIGLSGDLEDPQKSIPRGTLLAVGVGTLAYLIIPVLLAITGEVKLEELADVSPGAGSVWTKIALFGGLLVFPGMCSAILSSAFGSALAGPRVLQALARDGLMPRFLARVSKTGQPTLATWVGGGIALAAVALGNLNNVAVVVTIFFLTLYLSINVVAATESLVSDPSWRPTIRVHWSISLLGALAVLAVMFLISPIACVVAMALELGVWLYLRRRHLKAGWGDVWAGVWGSLARFSLRKYHLQDATPRSWRPQILLFADRVEQRAGLVRMAGWFTLRQGVLTVCDVLPGEPDADMDEAQQRRDRLERFLQREGIGAFAEVNVVGNYEQGVIDIVQANGLGALRCNTIVFGWPRRLERLEAMLRTVRTLYRIGKPAMIIRSSPPTGPVGRSRIDVWWRGKQNNGDLMLMLAYLLTLNPSWRDATITLRTIVGDEASRAAMVASLDELIESVRIPACAKVMVTAPDQTTVQAMHEASRDADVVFAGLQVPAEGAEAEYAQRLQTMVTGFPTTVLVRNSGGFAGKLI